MDRLHPLTDDEAALLQAEIFVRSILGRWALSLLQRRQLRACHFDPIPEAGPMGVNAIGRGS